MSLKLNVAANFASQLYTTLIGIILVPMYLNKMGAEAYGLIGFFSMLQAWFSVFDLGLTPTIARETARFSGGGLAAIDFCRIFRALSIIFVAVAAVCGGGLYLFSPVLSEQWLQVKGLPLSEVELAVKIMAGCVAMRWMAGLYRGIITGVERLVWLSGFNVLVASLRFVAVLLSMEFWGYTPTVFFWHQMAVGVLEVAILGFKGVHLVPSVEKLGERIGWSLTSVIPLLRFSLTIAFTSSVWVFVTQTDKLILSGILSLSEYGFFTLAVLLAGGITVVTAPLTSALLPRFARLFAENNFVEIIRLYHQFGQLVAVIAVSLMITLASCTESLLFAWTGNSEASLAASASLRLYALGNGMLALGAFPFYLQYARGDMHWHLVGNVGMVLLLIPAIILAASHFGGEGAGWVWLIMNFFYLFVWVAFVHGKLEPGLHREWIWRNFIVIVLPTAAVGVVLSFLFPPVLDHRGKAAINVMIFATLCSATAALSSNLIRSRVESIVRSRLAL